MGPTNGLAIPSKRMASAQGSEEGAGDGFSQGSNRSGKQHAKCTCETDPYAKCSLHPDDQKRPPADDDPDEIEQSEQKEKAAAKDAPFPNRDDWYNN